MAVTFKHGSVGGELSQDEWESPAAHMIGDSVAGDVILVSQPPSGMCRVVNVYWNPQNHKAVFEFNDVPEP